MVGGYRALCFCLYVKNGYSDVRVYTVTVYG